MKTAIIWFKSDLRIHDNEALYRAAKENDLIIPVYCFDDQMFVETKFGFNKTGIRRLKLITESLIELNTRLNLLGTNLLVLKGKTEIELLKLVKQYGVKKVYAKKEVSFEEINLNQKVEEALWKNQCEFEVFSTSTLYHAEDLPFSVKDIPDIFTKFKTAVEKECEIRPMFPSPEKLISPPLPSFIIPNFINELIKDINHHVSSAFPYKGGEHEALRRVNYYLFESKLISNYKNTRNQLIGRDYSSKFSPWLALGCLSPRFIYHEIIRYEQEFKENESTYWLKFELIWRDFFRFMMKKHRNAYFKDFGIKEPSNKIRNFNLETIQKWINGKTGVPLIDANMLELKHTGFMSNRGRQIVASFLCNDLKQDWRYGAAYFEEQLIDYDVCSNWGNWAYIAGVGNDPRKDRYFDVEKQTKLYDKDSLYRNLWLAKVSL
jgi:deoxyribodipyrimidine photo-lyase